MAGFYPYHLFIVFWAITALGGESRSPRIKRVVGGAPLEPGQWPFLVSLHYKREHPFTNKTGQRHLCAGTLIGSQWVLTAGHCFDGDEWRGLERKKNWIVMVGEHNQYKHEGTEQRMKIKRVFRHPRYSARPLLGDLTLLKLKDPVELNSNVQTIKLDYAGRCIGPGTNVAVAGWGQIAYKPMGWSMYIPLRANLTIMEKERCIAGYRTVPDDEPDKEFYAPEEDTILCAGSPDGGRDACLGDSGGPLACYYDDAWHEGAVVSTGYNCGLPEYPGLYTSLESYMGWINQTIENH